MTETATPLRRIGTILLTIVIALAISSLMIIAVGRTPWETFRVLFEGAFGTRIKVADTFVVWVSLSIASAGLLITFRAGQWNIGVEGQIVLGAVFATGASRLVLDAPGIVGIPVMILAGMVGGMVWGVLVGLLKIYGGVNEIFGGLGLNFIATSLVIYLIAGPWKPPGTSSITGTAQLPDPLWLPTPDGLRYSPISIVIALLVVVIVYFSLRGTIWGLELKAIGRNIRSAFVLGIPTNRVLLTAYAACGICAGLVGAILITGVRHQLVANISSGYGFLGILIVLLSGFNGLLAAPIALFFAALGIGGSALLFRLDLDSSLSGVLQGVLVLSFELVQGLRQKWAERRKRSLSPAASAAATGSEA